MQGKIADGETKAFELALGAHLVMAKIDWCKTSAIEIIIRPDQTAILQCGSEMTDEKVITAIFYVFKPGKFIYLRKSN